jgi:hypothetical protein
MRERFRRYHNSCSRLCRRLPDHLQYILREQVENILPLVEMPAAIPMIHVA